MKFIGTGPRRLSVMLVVLSVMAAAASSAQATGSRTVVDTVPGVRILDVSPDRILFLQSTDPNDPVISMGLRVKDRSSGAVTDITPPSQVVQYGLLTSHGAIYVIPESTSPFARLLEWRDGATIDLGGINSSGSLVVTGDYAIWNVDPSMYRRDLASGTNTLIEPTPGVRIGNTDNDVAANADVVYWERSNFEIYRFRQGSTTQLTSDSSLWNTSPRTDGINVVFRKVTACCPSGGGWIAVRTPDGQLILDSFREQWPVPGIDYQASGGWVAFTRIGTSGNLEVWTRDPGGNVAQVSPSGLAARVVGMNESGEVAFRAGPNLNNLPTLYIGRAGSTPVDFGPSAAWGAGRGTGNTVFFQNGQWYEAVGRTLSLLSPNGYPRPAAGVNTRVPLAVAFKECNPGNANRTHGPSLTAPSCNPAEQESLSATVGTMDGNGESAQSVGSVKLASACNPPAPRATPPCSAAGDQADVSLELNATDIRAMTALSDYTGELQATVELRITDKLNGDAQAEAATVTDLSFSFTAPCTATLDPAIGATCEVATYADSVVPGSVPEGRRSNWELGQVQVFDGGPDGQASTPGNTLFAVQGIFVP